MIDWSSLSHQQVTALDKLCGVVPIHWTYATKVLKIRGPTLTSLVNRCLVDRIYLVESRYPGTIGMPFVCLTREGEAVQRDWRRWNKKISSLIAGSMNRSKELEL